MSFDITIAFDRAKYLNPQIRMFIDTLKDNIPEDTILHVVTNRGKNDEMRKYIKENINSKFYFIRKTDELQSRCRYMLNTFKVKTDKEWIIKMEMDMLILKHLSAFENILDDKLDLILEPENRKIFPDETEEKLWRIIYRAMGIKKPTFKIEFRENNEMGLPLIGTGIICVKTKHLDKINERWIPLTKICEKWINLNTHPNEMGYTGLILDEKWKWKLYPRKYKLNPIGIFRKNEFPSIELIDGCKLPKDTVIFDYHRPYWLMHVAKYNKNIGDIICRNSKYIPKDWWDESVDTFKEK